MSTPVTSSTDSAHSSDGQQEQDQPNVEADSAPSNGSQKTNEPSKHVLRNFIYALAVWGLYSILIPLLPYRPKLFTHQTPEFFFRLFTFHFIPAIVYIGLQIQVGWRYVQLNYKIKHLLIAVVACTVAYFIPYLLLYVIHHPSVPLLFWLGIFLPLISNTALTIGLTSIGMIVSNIVREPNVLLPVAVVAIPVDYVGAMLPVGFTHTVVQKHPDIVSKVTVHVPHITGINIDLMLGPGDILFIAFFLAAIFRLGLNVKGTLIWMTATLAITLCLVIVTPYDIAALIPMGISVICANFRYFKLKREEVFAMIYATLVVFVVVGAFYFFAHRALAPK